MTSVFKPLTKTAGLLAASLALSGSAFAVAITDISTFITLEYLGASNVTNPGAGTPDLTITAESEVIDSDTFVDSVSVPATGIATLSNTTTPPVSTVLTVGDTVDLAIASRVEALGPDTVSSAFSVLQTFIGLQNDSNTDTYSVEFALTYGAELLSSVVDGSVENAFGSLDIFLGTDFEDVLDLAFVTDSEFGPTNDGAPTQTQMLTIDLFSLDQNSIFAFVGGSLEAEGQQFVAAAVPLPSSFMLMLLAGFAIRRRR